MTLHSEINEQPQRIATLLSSQRKSVEKIAVEIQKRDVQYVFLAARGTSDNAGRYANYLLGAMNGLPLALATPSLFTYYNRPPKLKNALVLRKLPKSPAGTYFSARGTTVVVATHDGLIHAFSGGAYRDGDDRGDAFDAGAHPAHVFRVEDIAAHVHAGKG